MPRLTRPPQPPFQFLTRPRLALEHGPPARPPWRRGYGSYCIKATCDLDDGGGGGLIGRVIGYDRYVHIQDAVERACEISARHHPGSVCGPVRLTMLHDVRKECCGEVYFVSDPSTTRRIF